MSVDPRPGPLPKRPQTARMVRVQMRDHDRLDVLGTETELRKGGHHPLVPPRKPGVDQRHRIAPDQGVGADETERNPEEPGNDLGCRHDCLLTAETRVRGAPLVTESRPRSFGTTIAREHPNRSQHTCVRCAALQKTLYRVSTPRVRKPVLEGPATPAEELVEFISCASARRITVQHRLVDPVLDDDDILNGLRMSTHAA